LKPLFVILLIVCLPAPGRSQYLDSLGATLRGDYSVDVRLESRNSFIDYQLVSITGVRAGLSFRRKLRLGVGLSWIETPVISAAASAQVKNDTAGREQLVKLAYICYYADVVFHKTKRWQLSVPLQLGTGLIWLEDPLLRPELRSGPKKMLLLYEPGISVQYKFYKWLGTGADIAYRFTLPNSAIAGQLSSPTYSFRLLIWFDQLYFQLFPGSRITKRFGPSYW
jgi:hypothetical protein